MRAMLLVAIDCVVSSEVDIDRLCHCLIGIRVSIDLELTESVDL